MHPTIQKLLQHYSDIFQEPKELPPARSIDHKIPLIDEQKQVTQRAYILPHHQKNAMELLVNQLLNSKMIQPSVSPYSSPVILVKKKDGSWRLCVDYRQLNSNTVKNKYPIPIIKDLLDELFEIRMKDEDIQKTTFTTHMGHYEYVVMPFGLTNAPATFQALKNTILAEYLRKFALVFFDDILVYSKSMTDHVQHLSTIFEVLRTNKLHAKLSKCTFWQRQVEYLGYIISSEEVATVPAKMSAIANSQTPKIVTELRGFLGLAGYYRRFIEWYGVICRPLFDCLKKEFPLE